MPVALSQRYRRTTGNFLFRHNAAFSHHKKIFAAIHAYGSWCKAKKMSIIGSPHAAPAQRRLPAPFHRKEQAVSPFFAVEALNNLLLIDELSAQLYTLV
ncbi:MAG: hypothetical protein D3908_09105 [Candidatus Electrothrix sp. AUS4]|nr:hypothetical protein [Candidatus Electrothrix sp. AUS4]